MKGEGGRDERAIAFGLRQILPRSSPLDRLAIGVTSCVYHSCVTSPWINAAFNMGQPRPHAKGWPSFGPRWSRSLSARSAARPKVKVADMKNLASDLEALLKGALTAEDFRSRYQSSPTSAVIDAIWGNLEHYLADADIRARDPEYRAMQNGEMLKLIGLVREDAPIVELRRVNFLGRA
jgi:hypothetical protein